MVERLRRSTMALRRLRLHRRLQRGQDHLADGLQHQLRRSGLGEHERPVDYRLHEKPIQRRRRRHDESFRVRSLLARLHAHARNPVRRLDRGDRGLWVRELRDTFVGRPHQERRLRRQREQLDFVQPAGHQPRVFQPRRERLLFIGLDPRDQQRAERPQFRLLPVRASRGRADIQRRGLDSTPSGGAKRADLPSRRLDAGEQTAAAESSPTS